MEHDEWGHDPSQTAAGDKAAPAVPQRKYNLRHTPIRLIPFTEGSVSADSSPRVSFEEFSMTFTARAAAATAAIAVLLAAGPASSQPGLALPGRPDAATDKFATMDKPARRAISVACSKEADDQGLKGRARGKFRSACKRDAFPAPTDKPK
jgi:hypothetical protein